MHMTLIPGLITAGGDATGAGNPIVSLLITFLPIILIFYFLIIRPQKKKEKDTKKMLEALTIGDNITTIGGICGKITELREDAITIEVGKDKTKLVFERWAIKSVDKPVSAD